MSDRISASDHCASGHFDRRSTIKMVGLGGVALLAGVGFATPAHALAQEGWRWCNKCQGMFFGGGGNLGICPAGLTHNLTGSGHYYQRVEGNIPNVQQGGWRWCARCMGFFYGAGPTLGSCPAGGTHTTTGSGSYAAVVGNDAVGQQGGWRWCNKCMGLSYSLISGGVCPQDHAAHSTAGSGNYACLF